MITYIFFLECIIKIIAMGFCCGKNTYLSSGWNKLDFIVVLTGIWSELFKGKNISVIRTIRLLRPLRSINKVRGISDIIRTVFNSIAPLINVTLFLFFIIVLIATFGLHLFYGMFEYRCRLTEKPVGDEWTLLPDYYKLCNPDWNNCPAGSFCGAPRDYNMEWDPEEINFEAYNYGLTGFDNIG